MLYNVPKWDSQIWMYYIRVIYYRNGYLDWDYRPSELVTVGNHDYFGKKMNVLPIPTIGRGLCYKLELSNGTIPTDSQKPLMALKSTVQGMDKLKGFSLMIASRNTWQVGRTNYTCLHLRFRIRGFHLRHTSSDSWFQENIHACDVLLIHFEKNHELLVKNGKVLDCQWQIGFQFSNESIDWCHFSFERYFGTLCIYIVSTKDSNIHLEHRSQIREKISVVHTYVIGIVNMPVV